MLASRLASRSASRLSLPSVSSTRSAPSAAAYSPHAPGRRHRLVATLPRLRLHLNRTPNLAPALALTACTCTGQAREGWAGVVVVHGGRRPCYDTSPRLCRSRARARSPRAPAIYPACNTARARTRARGWAGVRRHHVVRVITEPAAERRSARPDGASRGARRAERGVLLLYGHVLAQQQPRAALLQR